MDVDREEELHAELSVINDAFWIRLCTMGDLGFAEAYMFGTSLVKTSSPPSS
jgi:cyclopropane-fatty-acyl-phospholipid synthase